MLAGLLAFTSGIILFALAGEADTMFLQIAGSTFAVLHVLAGAVSLWSAAKKL